MSELTKVSRRAVLAAAGALPMCVELASASPEPSDSVRPTPQQLAWQEAELSMFLHFGVNTFTDREWGEGTEDPRVFNPAKLDAAQWVDTAKRAGFKYMILTAKHHDGFCLWPSRHTEHSVKASPWRGGKGDVMREFAAACRSARMKMGFYLSPWDRHEAGYGDSPRYNAHFRAQLEELLTQYGEVAEVWFDGACGEGPNGKRQEYDWPSFYEVVRKHQPKALIAICGPDIRWVGNEDGFARETEWSVQPANPTNHGTGERQVWWPAECDVSIRPGWFWHEREDAQVKTLEHLVDIYFRSVGRNSMLLLNVPPNRDGLVAEPDVRRLGEFRRELDRLFANDVAKGRRITRSTDGRQYEVRFAKPATVGIVLLQERIAEGQHVEGYRVDGQWREVSKGTTIGCKKLDRVQPVTADALRLTIVQTRAEPKIKRIGAFEAVCGGPRGHADRESAGS